MLWGGRWEGGSCLGTHVRIKDFKIKKKLKIKKKKVRQNRSSESKDGKAEKKPDAGKTVQTHKVAPGGNTCSYPFSI